MSTDEQLTERAQHLLRALIESYIRDGQPVGSRSLSRESGLQLSSATIRNVMADLEELGFVASPHTSAGRIPTDKGYRFFVDTLLRLRPLESGTDPGIESEIRQMLEAYRTGFPDLHHRIKHHVESGDTIAIELDAIGTHTGPMQTPQGVVPATGKRVVFESCDYIRFRGDKVVSWHVYHDPIALLAQLGVAGG